MSRFLLLASDFLQFFETFMSHRPFTSDMFRPAELIVSVQGTFCLIDIVDRYNLQDLKHVPKNLVADVRDGINPVRTYK